MMGLNNSHFSYRGFTGAPPRADTIAGDTSNTFPLAGSIPTSYFIPTRKTAGSFYGCAKARNGNLFIHSPAFWKRGMIWTGPQSPGIGSSSRCDMVGAVLQNPPTSGGWDDFGSASFLYLTGGDPNILAGITDALARFNTIGVI